MEDAKTRGQSAYDRRAWTDAYEAFSQASAEGPLDADDVERLALAAGVSGHEESAIEAFERLYQLRLDAGDRLRATRAAFWAAMRSFTIGEMARGGGWLARAQRLVDREAKDCVERGYLLLPRALHFSAAGDYGAAREMAAEAAKIGDRHGERSPHERSR